MREFEIIPSVEYTREEVIAGVGEKYAETAEERVPGAPVLANMDADILAILTGRDIAELSLKYGIAFRARPLLEVQDGSAGA